jgi:hypothetical protein
MCDKPTGSNSELFSSWAAELPVAFKEVEKESRRSFEISASFFEKLSALDAASIAVAASAIIAIIIKPELNSCLFFQQIVHVLIVIVLLLWASLIFSVLHNYIFARIAALDASYSGLEFLITRMRTGMAIVRDNATSNEQIKVDKLEKEMVEGSLKSQKRIVKWTQILHPCMKFLGYFSVLMFLAAYTIAAIYLSRLW